MIPEYLFVALQTLRANPLRTLLSTLGVIIGVGSLVSILSLADGVEAFSRAELESTTDLHVVTLASVTTERHDGVVLRRRNYPVFTERDAESLQVAVGPAAAVAITIDYAGFWNAPGDTAARQALVTALTPRAFRLREPLLLAGRLITEDDVITAAPVALVSHRIAERLGGGAEEATGRDLRVDGRPLTIVGVLAGEGSVDRIAIPLASAGSLPDAPDARPPVLVLRAGRLEDVPAVRSRAQSWLAERWDAADEVVSVSSNAARLEQATRGMLVFKLVMAAIAGISLVVGGIGIMNVLLASVTERTREIGIRQAAGARRRDIRRQFLAESVAISALGSGLGTVLGMTASLVALHFIGAAAELELRPVFAWQSLGLAIGAALLVGVVFGTYPALRAARLSPMEALRHE